MEAVEDKSLENNAVESIQICWHQPCGSGCIATVLQGTRSGIKTAVRRCSQWHLLLPCATCSEQRVSSQKRHKFR